MHEKWKTLKRQFEWNKYLLLLALPGVIYFIIFHYIPMYGVTIAFKDYSPRFGILGSPWIGFRFFQQFFNSIYFGRLVRNTLLLNIYNLLWGFPAPIILALILNEFRKSFFKSFVQTVSYLPHFVSTVVVVGIMLNFLSPNDGLLNRLLTGYGFPQVNLMSDIRWFRTLYVGSGIWQTCGWNSIIYLAALSGINPELYESAEIDGAGRWKQMVYITLPSILPTIMILFILNMGRLMSVGFEKILLMYSPATYEVADVISTFVYRRGILDNQFSFGSAVGLFNSVVNVMLLVITNHVSKRVNDTALW